MTLLLRMLKALPEDATVELANDDHRLVVRLRTGRWTKMVSIAWAELDLSVAPETLVVERLRGQL